LAPARAYRLRFRRPGTVAGSGPERENLEALASSLGLGNAVTFAGQLDNAKMADIYRVATIMLNPSLVDKHADRGPAVARQRRARGQHQCRRRPTPGARRSTALLVPPGLLSRWQQAMGRIAVDKILARRLSEAGSAAGQAYAWAEVKPRLFFVYARALGVASPTPRAS
jgi:hypothetical protein